MKNSRMELKKAAYASMNAGKRMDERAYKHAQKRYKKLAKRERLAGYADAA